MTAGDDRFEALYARHFGDVLAYTLRRAPRALAQDATAETFLVVWRRLDDVPDNPLPWLLAVARKSLANQRRSAHRQHVLIERLAAEPRQEARPTTSSTDHRSSPLFRVSANATEKC